MYNKEWFLIYRDKIKDFKVKNYYNIIDILKNNKVIINCQVFKKKLIINNYILSYYIINKNKEFRFKARQVIQGFYQIYNIKFLKTFNIIYYIKSWYIILIIGLNISLKFY